MGTFLGRAGWLVAGGLGLFIIAAMAGVVSGGPLDPPAPPASTLPQVEPRIPIRQPAPAGFPISISQPGSYFLAENITGVASKVGIEINADNVTIDLNGFSLRGVSGSQDGIHSSGHNAIVIRNGLIQGWEGSGVDLYFSTNAVIDHVVADQNGNLGAVLPNLAIGDHGRVSDCTASDGAARGIEVYQNAVVERCLVSNNTYEGIYAFGQDDRITENHVVGSTASSAGIALTGFRGIATGNTVEDNACCGIYVSGDQSIVHSNTLRNNGGGGANNVFVPPLTCNGCDVGPSADAATATSPWANISD